MGKVHWRSLAEALREITRLQKLAREAVELGEEASGRTSACMTVFRSALEQAASVLGWTGDHCKRCSEQGPDRG